MTPDTAPGLGRALREEFGERVDRVGKTLKRVRREADEEAIHDLRVAARRLEAALDLWRGGLRPAPAGRARKKIRRVRKRLGEAREHEVHAALLDRVIEGAPASLARACDPLRARLRRACARARRRAAGEVRPGLVRTIRRRVDEGPWFAPLPVSLVLADASTRRAGRAGAARRAMQAARQSGKDADLHAARIRVKKWRYAAEGLASVERRMRRPQRGGVRTVTAGLNALRDVQEALGDAHDMATLREVVERERGRLTRRGRAAEASALQPVLKRIEALRRAAVGRFRVAAARTAALGAVGGPEPGGRRRSAARAHR